MSDVQEQDLFALLFFILIFFSKNKLIMKHKRDRDHSFTWSPPIVKSKNLKLLLCLVSIFKLPFRSLEDIIHMKYIVNN